MKAKTLIILNLLLLLVVLFITYYKPLTNYYYINDDIRTLFYIKNFNSDLQDNLLAQYSFSKMVGTTMYHSYLYFLIDKFMDFIIFSKLVGIISFLVSIVFIYKLGKVIKNKVYSLILVFMFIVQPWIFRPFPGGLSRSLAYPLLAAFIYYILIKDNVKISLVLLLEAVFYPPILLVCILAFFLNLINLQTKKVDIQLKYNYLVYISIFFSLILAITPTLLINYGIKNQITFNEAIQSEEFYEGGAHQMFIGSIPFTSDMKSLVLTFFSIYNVGIRKPFITNQMVILLFFILIFSLVYRQKIYRIPKEFYMIVVSSFILQTLAFIVLPKLFLPFRYVQYTIPLFLILILSNALYNLSKKKKQNWIFFLLIALLAGFYVYKIYILPEYYPVFCEDKDLYEYLKSLPKNKMVAEHPTNMGCSALYGEIKPFIMSALNIPFYKDYYEKVRQRNFDFFTAYYSSNEKNVKEFCRKYDIGYIIVDRYHFDNKFIDDKMKNNFYDLIPSGLSNYVYEIAKNSKEYYLLKSKNKVFELGNKFIFKCLF